MEYKFICEKCLLANDNLILDMRDVKLEDIPKLDLCPSCLFRIKKKEEYINTGGKTWGSVN